MAAFERGRALGVPVIVVLFSGRPLVIPELAERADALLAEAGHLDVELNEVIALVKERHETLSPRK